MQGIYTRFCTQNRITPISGLAANNIFRKIIVKVYNNRIRYTRVALRRSDEGITTDFSNNLGKGDVHLGKSTPDSIRSHRGAVTTDMLQLYRGASQGWT